MSSLNVRAEKRRLTTVGVFCPRTTAELGDRPGLVSARMVSLLSLIISLIVMEISYIDLIKV